MGVARARPTRLRPWPQGGGGDGGGGKGAYLEVVTAAVKAEVARAAAKAVALTAEEMEVARVEVG